MSEMKEEKNYNWHHKNKNKNTTWEHHEWLNANANKLYNLDETYKFLEIHNFPWRNGNSE